MSGQRSLEPKPAATGDEKILQIPEREFIQTRDKIVTGLTTLIGVITELNTAFIKHTNDLANEGGANINSLSSVSISNFLSTAGKAVTGAGLASDLVKVKRKRVKKEKDPNAPKRPLTAFFLYSTFARPEVKDELGDVSPVEINNEILRRWKEMPAPEKQTWKDRYEDNNKKYKEQVAAYKARTGVDPEAIAGAHEDGEEGDEAEEHGEEEGEEDSEDDETEEDEDEEPEPVKPPTPPPAKAKKAKAAPKAKGKENGAPTVPSPSPSAQLRVTSELPASKDKTTEKRKKADKEAVEEPKKKKARKSDAKEEVVPAAEKKTEKKKKRKGEA